jgi:hypothetical protein
MLLWQPLGRLEGDWEIMVWRGGDIRRVAILAGGLHVVGGRIGSR